VQTHALGQHINQAKHVKTHDRQTRNYSTKGKNGLAITNTKGLDVAVDVES
jgi:hypothetical protein